MSISIVSFTFGFYSILNTTPASQFIQIEVLVNPALQQFAATFIDQSSYSTSHVENIDDLAFNELLYPFAYLIILYVNNLFAFKDNGLNQSKL